MAEETINVKRLLGRILKAAFWGFIAGGEVLLFYQMPGFDEQFASFLPADEFLFLTFVIVFISFEVTMQLLSGTIFQYALGSARALISMALLVYVTNGGIMTIAIPFDVVTLHLMVEFRAILAVFLIFSLVTVVKNVLLAIEFLSGKAEQPMIPAEIP